MHTPGPWIVKRWWDETDWRLADDEERAELLQDPIIGIDGGNGESVVRCHDLATIRSDDAHLIAAAPDLLTALERIASFDSKYATSSPGVTVAIITDIARAAIAKARGE